MKKYWLHLNFLFLIVVAIIGVMLRGVFTGATTDINYQFALHAHSHTGFIGWVYQMLFFALVSVFLLPEQVRRGYYALQLGITMLLSAGMIASFWMQGYGSISITLSSIFQVVSYWFVWRLWQDGNTHLSGTHSYSWQYIQIALAALFASTLGPWALAVISANGLQGTSLYSMAIYFYMHFQFNGWFVFAILGLFFHVIERHSGEIDSITARRAFVALAVSIFPAYVLSIVHLKGTVTVYVLGIFSGLGQLAGLGLLAAWFFRSGLRFGKVFENPWVRSLIGFALAGLALKYVLQILALVPGLDDIAFNNRNVIIAFLHLVVLGVVTFSLIALLAQNRLLNMQPLLSRAGTALLIAGFLITELTLVSPVFGYTNPDMFRILYYSGISMLSGIVLIWGAQFKKIQ